MRRLSFQSEKNSLDGNVTIRILKILVTNRNRLSKSGQRYEEDIALRYPSLLDPSFLLFNQCPNAGWRRLRKSEPSSRSTAGTHEACKEAAQYLDDSDWVRSSPKHSRDGGSCGDERANVITPIAIHKCR
jgi:hypothetical protein